MKLVFVQYRDNKQAKLTHFAYYWHPLYNYDKLREMYQVYSWQCYVEHNAQLVRESKPVCFYPKQ